MPGTRSLLVVVLALSLGCSSSSHEASFANVAAKATPDSPAGADKQQEAQARKIVYKANLELVVDDLDKAEEQIAQLVPAQGGYVAKSDVRGTAAPGSPRSGTWTVRIPVDHFNAFMQAAGKLGELTASNTDSDDITDKFYDLQAHMKNNQTEEEGLRKLLIDKSAAGKLEDILTIRRELQSIRGTIDQQQGQLNRWSKEADLSTITLKIHDRKDYVPPPAPGLAARIGRTWTGSLDALASLGESALLIAIAIVPWLPLIAAVIVPVWLWLRRANVRKPTRQAKEPAASTGNPFTGP